MNPVRTLEVLLAAMFICVSARAASPESEIVIARDPAWQGLIAGAVKGRGGIDAAVARLDAIRSGGSECEPGRVPGGVIDWVVAGLYEQAGRIDAAIARYRAAAGSPLGDVASFRIGMLLDQKNDIAGARAAWGAVSPASAMWVEARRKLAGSLMAENRPEAAVQVILELFHDEMRPHEIVSARLALARALDAAGRRGEAVAMALAAWFLDRDGSHARDAAALLKSLGSPLSPAIEVIREIESSRRRDLKPLCRRIARNRKALSSIDPALPEAASMACLIYRDRIADSTAGDLQVALGRASSPDVRAWIIKLAAEAAMDGGDDAAAGEWLARLVDGYPASPLAPGAASDGARAFMRVGLHDRASEILEAASKSVMAPALARNSDWMKALAAMMAGRREQALAHLDAILETRDRGNGVMFGLAERARYFRGVTLFGMGRSVEAREDLERVARASCCSWYGMLAASRLSGWFGVQVEGGAPAGLPDGTHARDMAGSVGHGLPAVIRTGATSAPGVFLFMAGERSLALRELSTRARRCVLDEDGLQFLASARAAGMGARDAMKAASFLRGRIERDTAWLWTAAWPRPWHQAVERASAVFDVDAALIYSVMRIESGFRKSVRSPAGAGGLMQLMPATAATVAGKAFPAAGLKPKASGPDGNVMAGAALLDQLITHFQGNLPLVLAGYNAGSGAGRRFLRRLGSVQADLFVEAVPFERTREYIRLVGGNLAAYRHVYGAGAPAEMAFDLPQTTGPFLDMPSGGSRSEGVAVRGGPSRIGAWLRRPQ